MALHVTVAEVQSWLDQGKIDLPTNDQLPEEFNVATAVFSRLAQVFNTAPWVDNTTTPNLIRVIISAKVAANRYNKLYSEEDDAGNKYANKLENWADSMIIALLNGSVVLIDSPAVVANDPAFYPKDSTGSEQILDGLGFPIGLPGAEDIKFHMADRY